ncbi:Acyl-coa n-acyltransferase, partial [Globisporangium polare]
VQLTQEELKIQTKIDDFAMWGAPALSQEQYQRKESLQRATPFSQRGSIFWALVEKRSPSTDSKDDSSSDADLAAGKDLICAHCESHRFDCVFRKPNGELVRGFSHHIGSVFTLPAYRKQGLASLFLTEVAKSMAQLPGAVASALYSDIGPTFYDRLGWRLHPSTMAELDVSAPRNVAAIASADDEAVGTRLFLDQELDAFLGRDSRRIENEIQDAKYAGQEVFATLATRDSVEWQFCIGAYYASIRGLAELPTQCGLRIDDDAFVVWCHNLKESTLYVVRARFPESGTRPDVTQRLLRAALKEAHKFKLQHVAIWDPAPALFAREISSALDITESERPDSLSSAMVFAQHRDGVNTSDAPLPVWVANEKFAWV